MLPLILAGLALSRAADVEAENRREKLRQAMRTYQLGQSRIGQAAIEKLMTQETPQKRETELATLTADRAKSLQDTVGAAQSSNPAPIAGKLSADYKQSQERAANTVAERTRRAIEQLSAMGAPGEAALAHGIRYGRTAGTVDATNSAIGNVGNAFMGDIRNTVANPAIKLAGSALTAYGAGSMGAGAAGGMGNSGAYEDSEGNLQQSPYRKRVKRAFSLWGS